jgi:hypothetical protein
VPLRLGVDTTLLKLPSLVLSVTPADIDRALPIELNNAGHQLHYDLINEVADAFPDLPVQVIAAAIESREATAQFPTFSIISRDTMVTYVEWVTKRDEKVCPICGPRDGVTYRIIDVMDIWPAHPNCRCTLERLGITSAMLEAGARLMPEALQNVATGLLEEFARFWARHP